MAGGSAIRGSRVGAGPMGEAERGDAAPRLYVSYFCAHGHETRPAFAADATIPDAWDCPRAACQPISTPGIHRHRRRSSRTRLTWRTSRSAAPTRKRPTSSPRLCKPSGAARTRRGHLLIRSFAHRARGSAYFVVARRGKSASAPPAHCSLRSLRLALISRCLPHSLADDEACLLARSSRTAARSLAQHGGCAIPDARS